MLLGSRAHLLIKRGRLYAHIVVIDGSVKVTTLPVRVWDFPEEFHLRPLLKNNLPYPVDEAVQRLLKAGVSLGISEAADKLLRGDVPRN